MPDDRKYVRVFHADLIRDYPDVWDDDAALAAWLRLLVAADGSWPAPAELARSVKPRVLTALMDAGLVWMAGANRYRVKGMDADRSQRQDAARNAAAQRWHSGRNATGNAPKMPNNSEQNRTTQSSAEPRATNDPYDDAEGEALSWLSKHGCDIRQGNGYHQKLVVAVEQHGSNAVIGMFDRLARAGTKQGDVKGFLFGAIDALNAQTRPKVAELDAEDREEKRRESFAIRAARTREETAPLREALEQQAAKP